jgi:cell division protease FtsH
LKDNKGADKAKNMMVWIAIAVALMMLFSMSRKQHETASTLDYSEFLEKVHAGQVVKVQIEGKNNVTGVTTDGSKFSVYAPTDAWLISDLIKSKVKVRAKPDEEPSLLFTIFISYGPILLMVGVWIYFMRQQMNGGKGGGPFSFGKSKAKMLEDDGNIKTFADVAGCDEAKHDVTELVDFLRDPGKFQKLGGRMPKGVLMVGPPGTGKTLLAKSVAGEAKVPFFSISGSDFVEMFVGVGAARVRDMFEQAKKHAPCIIFIDEIDAVGRHRGAGVGGGNDEREQTLNQLLVEMDGFEASAGIIIIAATNRPDVLDPALLRPGRLDRQVVVGLPDIRGREQILNVHTRKVPISSNVQLRTVARGTPGFSGADLANLVNEAALFAARRNKRFVEMDDFESAKDKIIMGAERQSAIMPEEELRNTAYHESGHAVIARVIPGMDPVHKVTIIPRGRALGVTMQLPEKDRYSNNRQELLNQIAMLYGGRLAEEIFMGQMTTGASNDFQRATDIARRMVCEWGMSDMGVMVFGEEEGEVFLGRSVTRHKTVSEGTQMRIDGEIQRILDEQYQRAKTILIENKDKVEAMTKALLDIETIELEQIDDIMSGNPIREYDERLQVAKDRRWKYSEPVVADVQASDSNSQLPKVPPAADASA